MPHLSSQVGLNASPPSAIVNDFTAESNSEILCNIVVFNAHFAKMTWNVTSMPS